MPDCDEEIKKPIEGLVDPESGDIDKSRLDEFMLGVVGKMENGCSCDDADVEKLLALCHHLWMEKENWRKMFCDLADRYNKHLDSDIATYSKWLKKMK